MVGERFACPNPLCKKTYEHDELDVGVIVCPSCGTPLVSARVKIAPVELRRSRMAMASVALGLGAVLFLVLLKGWIFGLALGVFAIACGVDSLQVIARHPEVVYGKRMATFGALLGSGAFIIGFAMVMWTIAQTRENRSTAEALSKTMGDKSRLEKIYGVVERYRANHEGEYPESLQTLLLQYPNYFPGRYLDWYEYEPPPQGANPSRIMAYTNDTDLYNRRCVLYTDGEVRYLPEVEFRSAIAATGGGSPPPGENSEEKR